MGSDQVRTRRQRFTIDDTGVTSQPSHAAGAAAASRGAAPHTHSRRSLDDLDMAVSHTRNHVSFGGQLGPTGHEAHDVDVKHEPMGGDESPVTDSPSELSSALNASSMRVRRTADLLKELAKRDALIVRLTLQVPDPCTSVATICAC